MRNQKGFANIIIIIVVLVALAGAGYYFVARKTEVPQQAQVPISTQQMVSSSPSAGSGQSKINISDWKTYRNEKYGFEVKYPEVWERDRNNEKNYVVFNAGAEPTTNNQFPDFVSIEITENKKSKTLEELYPGGDESRAIYRVPDVGAKKTYEILESGDAPPRYVFVTSRQPNGLIFTIWIRANQETTNQILSTFKFTK